MRVVTGREALHTISPTLCNVVLASTDESSNNLSTLASLVVCKGSKVLNGAAITAGAGATRDTAGARAMYMTTGDAPM